ncbi:acyl carrier protein [uncultured Desulfosarcina sp.]|uniref:acyl carrier protein n=1 Tax=uncultured Desulfosarcina sp. TaxID=218289 RepID=UPI0029C6D096|nr:acyl carrier protein [uncultured Desulfosarcina sp.]
MRKEEIDRIVLELLGQVAPEAPLDSLDAHRPFRDQFMFDSVDFLNFMLKLEEKTGVRIPELDYPALSSLEGCRNYLGAGPQ